MWLGLFIDCLVRDTIGAQEDTRAYCTRVGHTLGNELINLLCLCPRTWTLVQLHGPVQLQLQLHCTGGWDLSQLAVVAVHMQMPFRSCWMCVWKKASVASQLLWLGHFPSSHSWCLLLSASPLLCLHTPNYCLCVWAVCWTQLGAGEYRPVCSFWLWTIHRLPVFLWMVFLLLPLTKLCLLSSFGPYWCCFPLPSPFSLSLLFAEWISKHARFLFSYPASANLIISAADQSEQKTV